MASLQDDRGLNGDFHDRGSCILCLEMEELHKTREENKICRYSMSEPEKVDSLKPNNSNKRNHEIDLKRIFNFPNDIKKEIYSYYLDFYRLRMNWNPIHQELTEKEHDLILTEHLFDRSADYHFIERMPALVPRCSDDQLQVLWEGYCVKTLQEYFYSYTSSFEEDWESDSDIEYID